MLASPYCEYVHASNMTVREGGDYPHVGVFSFIFMLYLDTKMEWMDVNHERW